MNNDLIFTESELIKKIKEISVSYSTAKKTLLFNDEPYFVGALARLNNNSKFLVKNALEVLDTLDLRLPSTNPFDNILAQYVEVTHLLSSILELFEKYEPRPCNIEYRVRNELSNGIGVIELHEAY